jgi:hypothetical protein
MWPSGRHERAKFYSAKMNDGENTSLGAVDVMQSVQHADGVSKALPQVSHSREGLSVYIEGTAKFIIYHGQRCRNPS